MARAEIAITLDEHVLAEVDRLVREGAFPNRSQAIEVAVREKLDRQRHSRLARELAKLDRAEEQAFAEEGYAGEEWPESEIGSAVG